MTKQNQDELNSKLWAVADELRGNMDANEFKNYALGMIFYKYLSEKIENGIIEEYKTIKEYIENEWNEDKEACMEELIDDYGYYIEPHYLFSEIEKKVENNDFEITLLQEAINSLVSGYRANEVFNNLFDDMDLNSSRLGSDSKTRSKVIGRVILKIGAIDFNNSYKDAEHDILGDAYEFLISRFAASAGKKAGEFYTPQQVSKILAKIVCLENNGKERTHIQNAYDPTCGSGSLLLTVNKQCRILKFYGQEKNSTTYNLARMNMLLHEIDPNSFDIKNGDTLENDEFKDQKFKIIVANPPYSANWSADPNFLQDERFNVYGKLAPKSKADFAFVAHMIHHLDEDGVMAVVLPHGVLFRGAAEGVMRKHLIKEDFLDAVIGLPSNIFFGTSIPTIILVFKKCKADKNVLFIDASNDYEKAKNQNILTDEHVEKIVQTYKDRKSVDKYAHLATIEEIEDNDYNLNIPRYVNTFEDEEQIDIKEVTNSINDIDDKILEIDKQLKVYLDELGL